MSSEFITFNTLSASVGFALKPMQGPMAPTIKVIDAASQDAVMVDRYLVEDTPDLMHSHEKSYGKFLDDAIGEAEIEMKDRF